MNEDYQLLSGIGFNPRPCVRGDKDMASFINHLDVSIHAPV